MTRVLTQPCTIRDVAALFWSTASGYVKRRILLALLLIAISSALTALAPLALGRIVDSLAHEDVNVAAGMTLVALYILSHWFARMAGELRSLVHGQADRRLYRAITDRLFHHVMQLPLRFHLERQTGALNETLSNGLQGFQLVLQTSIYTLIPVLVQLGTVAIVLVKIDQPVFLWLFLIAMVLYALVFSYGAVRITNAAHGASAAQVEARSIMTDCLLNYETVKCFTAEPVVRSRLDVALGRTESEWVRFYRRRAGNGVLAATIFAGFLAATVFYASRAVQAGTMSVGEFVLVNAYMLQLVAPLEQVGLAVQVLSQGYAFLTRMLDLFRETPEAGGSRVETEADRTLEPAALRFEHVSLSYSSGRQVLGDVSFDVRPGTTLGIVGSSGGGKSTLVRLLLRLIEPDRGRILLDEVCVSTLSLAALRKVIAVVPQDTVLFNESVGFNIGFGKPDSTTEEIERAARVAHLHEVVKKLPQGYATHVGERGVKLSGGERQRVSIARAAIKRPRLYVFDEATSSLDSRTEQEILSSLRELSRRATTLVIAHRLSTVVHADQIIVLHEGTVVEQGTHDHLLSLNGRYAALWSAQQPRAAVAS